MARLPHGILPTIETLAQAQQELSTLTRQVAFGFALAEPLDLHDYDFMFLDLQNSDNLLEETADMPEKLKALGRSMGDADDPVDDSTIPAAYTYFGQFIDHDITLEVTDFPTPTEGGMSTLLDDNMKPAELPLLRNALRNFRTATLDLDSLYGLPAPRDPENADRMLIGHVSTIPDNTDLPRKRPAGKGDDKDLPREPKSANAEHDRAALIGDPRNDENLIVSQFHLAMLKAHNALVDEGRSRVEAERLLRQHYQYLVINDFLKRVCDPGIVDRVAVEGNQWFNALGEPFFMPIEFAAAAYRFGHTMVRGEYNVNLNFNLSEDPGTVPATLKLLFDFTSLSGEFGDLDTDTLPENGIVEWERLLGTHPDSSMARKIDIQISSDGNTGLFALQGSDGVTMTPPDAARLSVRNLLRGYRLRVPTGQAIATHLGLPVLTPGQLQDVAGPSKAALIDGGFDVRTPLWYYMLAEGKQAGGNRLGPVGSTIVAEVLVGLVRRSRDSILATSGWIPSLPSAMPGTFELADLLRFAGVLGTQVPSTTYVVQPGDTLSAIAREELGDATRWPEIFVANRASIRNPNLINIGQVLTLPTGPKQNPQPRIYVVKAGDTLSGIAQRELGDASRWPEIYELNGAFITNPDVIVLGMVLVLPN